jgi:predicted nucleic acid-binding protein
MKDSVFLDTNILVYAHTDLDPEKQKIAQEIMRANQSIISTQVLQELANTLKKKFNHSWGDIAKVLAEASINNEIFINDQVTVTQACNVANRYGYSFYDSLIISAALATATKVLYSEDLQDSQIIEGRIRVENPFKILKRTRYD